MTDSQHSEIELNLAHVIRRPHVGRIEHFLGAIEETEELDQLNSLMYRVLTISEEHRLPTRIVAVAILTAVLAKELDGFVGRQRMQGVPEDELLRRIMSLGRL